MTIDYEVFLHLLSSESYPECVASQFEIYTMKRIKLGR